jgi:B12-binding domain/radical SAM domain protein
MNPFPSSNKKSRKLAIIFRYSRINIYSYNALIGALEIADNLSDIPVYIPKAKMFEKKIHSLYNKEQFDHLIACISCCTFQLKTCQKVVNRLRKKLSNEHLTIICGGPHPSAAPMDLLKTGADLIVAGEGEKTFQEVINHLRKGTDWRTNKGIIYQQNQGKLVTTKPNNPINLNEYPPFAPEHKLYSALEIARGCKFGCKFCQTPQLFGHKIRFRSPENIIEWGKYLLTQRDSWDFRFITPNAFGYYAKKSSEPNIEKIETLLKGLKNLKFKKRLRIYFGTFPSEVRPESVTEDTLALTKKYANNDNLTMGAQTGSERILKIIRRGHTLADVQRAIDLAKDFGFQMNIDIIFGFPEETSEDQFKTLAFCKDLIRKGCKLHVHYLIPLPGTAYENTEPKPVELEIQEQLHQWTGDGKVFGNWEKQMTMVHKKIVSHIK